MPSCTFFKLADDFSLDLSNDQLGHKLLPSYE